LVRPGAYPRVDHLKCPSVVFALVLLTKSRPGRKGLPWANTLAY
jgi:hypothetical protein